MIIKEGDYSIENPDISFIKAAFMRTCIYNEFSSYHVWSE